MTAAPDKKSTPPTPSADEVDEPQLTRRQAAALVKRPVPQPPDEDGKPQPDKLVAVREAEVLSHKVYDGGRVVVVTEDGKKFEGTLK